MRTSLQNEEEEEEEEEVAELPSQAPVLGKVWTCSGCWGTRWSFPQNVFCPQVC